MAHADNPFDLGIVLYLVGVPTGITYIDRVGTTQGAETLSTTYAAMSPSVLTSLIFAGAPQSHSLFCRLDFDQATSITIKLEQQYGNEGRLDVGWMATQSVRQDTGAIAAEHTFTSPGAGQSTFVVIQTASAHVSGKLRVSAKAAGVGFTATDRVEIALRSL